MHGGLINEPKVGWGRTGRHGDEIRDASSQKKVDLALI